MQLTRRRLLGTLAAATTLSGCAGDDSPGSATTTTETGTGTETSTETGPTVRVRSEEMGEILVGPDGLTLYMFDSDTNGDGTSSCRDDCAESWPPLTVEREPTAGTAVTAELTTVQRGDDRRQVAAGGWPLYYFAGDDDPGDTNGQGVDDSWWVLGPDGTPRTPETTTEQQDDGYDY